MGTVTRLSQSSTANEPLKIRFEIAGGEADPLAAIRELAVLSNPIDEALARYVRLAREGGSTWESIAAALGVSKQAAHERFSGIRRTTSYDDLLSQAIGEVLRLAKKEKERTGDDPYRFDIFNYPFDGCIRQLFAESGLKDFQHFRRRLDKKLAVWWFSAGDGLKYSSWY